MLAADYNKFPRRLGPYVLVNFLGEGGMGSVYLALMGNKGAAHFCVIKQMGSAYSGFSAEQLPEIEARFKREAEITMALSHAGIAKTIAVGEEQGPYFVQEFIDGLNLRTLMPKLLSAKQSLAVPLVSYIVGEVGKALGYLHDFEGRGLVHRDLTPDNVMLGYAGEVKLIDFGLAKATVRDEKLTQRGFVGKPEWLAPEIFKGAKIDRRVDLYSLGLLCWHLLSRQEPGFSMTDRLTDRPTTGERFHPVSKYDPEVSPELDRLVEKAMNPHPDRRYQTADEFLKALAAFIPAGFEGGKEVRELVLRNTNRLGDKLLPRLMDEGKGLLEGEARVRVRSKWRGLKGGVVVVGAALGVMLVGGGLRYLVKKGRGGETAPPTGISGPSHPPPPPLAPLAPSTATETATATEIIAGTADNTGTASQSSQVRASTPAKVKSVTETKELLPNPDQLLKEALDWFEQGELAMALSKAKLAADEGAGAPAFILIGRILAIRHDPTGARAAYEKALSLSPGNVEASRRLKRLNRRVVQENGP
jgi:hypothetical protein